MDREAAWQTVQEFAAAPGLRKHMLAVEAAMRWYAEQLGGDPESWGLAGLLHDFDWEIHPTLEQHPCDGAPILRERGLDESIIRTILSHNTEGTGVERESPRDYAAPRLRRDHRPDQRRRPHPPQQGRARRAAQVRPQALEATRAFAAGVDRDHVEEVTADFSRECFGGELDLWQHTANVLAAMQAVAADLELDGRLAR